MPLEAVEEEKLGNVISGIVNWELAQALYPAVCGDEYAPPGSEANMVARDCPLLAAAYALLYAVN